MYHGENAFTLSWRQLWGRNSPSGYKNKFSARVVIISASVSFFLCSGRIESLWQGLQISKHGGILSLSPQGLTFMCLHSCVLSPFPLLQKQDPHGCTLSMAEVFPSLPAPAMGGCLWDSLFHPCRAQMALGWVSALQGSCTSAGRRDVHMALPELGKDGLSPPGVRRNGKKRRKLVLSNVFWWIRLTSNIPSVQGSPAVLMCFHLTLCRAHLKAEIGCSWTQRRRMKPSSPSFSFTVPCPSHLLGIPVLTGQPPRCCARYWGS